MFQFEGRLKIFEMRGCGDVFHQKAPDRDSICELFTFL
jgi:hypothetical protein